MYLKAKKSKKRFFIRKNFWMEFSVSDHCDSVTRDCEKILLILTAVKCVIVYVCT